MLFRSLGGDRKTNLSFFFFGQNPGQYLGFLRTVLPIGVIRLRRQRDTGSRLLRDRGDKASPTKG